MNRKWIGVSLVVALLAAGIVSAFILADETNKEWKNHGCFDQLTEEQREAAKQKMQELQDAGATHEEIREAMQQFMEELGIDTKECGMKGQKGFGQKGFGGCHDQLTEEQREAAKQKIQELQDAGATDEEIREAMQQFMEELGINTEECGMRVGQKGMGGCFDQLTEEQREAALQKIQELKDAGATPEEIKEAMHQFMEELGINMDDCGMKGHGHGTESEGGS